MVQELLSKLVFSCNVDDQFGINHYRPQNQNSWILINKRGLRRQSKGVTPVLLCELKIVDYFALLD